MHIIVSFASVDLFIYFLSGFWFLYSFSIFWVVSRCFAQIRVNCVSLVLSLSALSDAVRGPEIPQTRLLQTDRVMITSALMRVNRV